MIQDAVLLLLQIAVLWVELLCTVIEILLILLTEMRFLNFTTGTWQGDTRSCEQGQIIYGCVTFNNRPININNMDRQGNNHPIKTSVSSDSSASSDGSAGSKTTTWGQLSSSGPKQSLIGSNTGQRSPDNSRPSTLEKNKNGKLMTWKDVSPTKSALGSDLEGSGNANVVSDCVNKCGKLTNQMTDNEKCECKGHSNNGSPCKRGLACLCSKQCISHRTDNDNETSVTRSSGSSNDNGSPRKEKGGNSADDTCNNDYFYDEDFSVQFDTNLRETSVTPVDIEPAPSILDFPHMVTGSYLSFNTGGSSNASYNNMRESANLSINNVPVSCAALHFIEDRGQYDSEFSGNSGNSGSRNSAMELSSSERDMMCSSDMIEFSDGPLFTPTPVHILSTDSLDRNTRELQGQGQGSEMNNSNTSADANLNVDCCPRKEDYFLSFDGSNTRVSGSETDISLSATSHDSGQGHWVQSETSTSVDSTNETGAGYRPDGVNVNVSSSENQEESSDSFHFCYSSKLSPLHRQSHHYGGKEGLTGRVIKRLVPLKETIPESTDSSEEEVEGNTSPTLTAGSKEITSSPQTSPQKQLASKPQLETTSKGKQTFKKKGQKSDNLILVGIGKPSEILRKAQYHSHTLPVKNLVSWKQVKNLKNIGITDNSKSKSLPELSTSTSWQSISSLKCRKLSEISDSFHGKRHSSSLLEFYQRMKSESNPVSPETLNNLEQILLPDFIGQKQQELSDSSTSSMECAQCQCHRQKLYSGMDGSISKAYTNKRISDWLKMECSSSSREGRPSSLGCQTNVLRECASKETLISPQTVTLWSGTKNAASQFPPVTKDCSMQTKCDSNYKDFGLSVSIGKKDQGLQTSDFDTDELLSILSENYEDYQFVTSNEGFSKEFQRHTSCPENFYMENGVKSRVPRSKSADEYKNYQKTMNPYEEHLYSHPGQGRSRSIGRSKSAGGLGCKSESPLRRMGYSSHYSFNSMPDIAFLMSTSSLSKEESKESLFDPLKIDLPTPVFIKPKTELEKIDIYNQTTSPCSCHRPLYCSEHKTKSSGHRNVHQVESASSSSGFSTSSSSGIDPGYCQCENYCGSSPQNDLERLIFFPPHTESIKTPRKCCGSKKRAHSVPKCLSECTGIPQGKIEKYAYEVHPQSGTKGQGQTRVGQKWNAGSKLVATETVVDNLYALEEEQTPVASPEQNCCHSDKCLKNDCHGNKNFPTLRERDVYEGDFYRATGRVMHIDHEYLREFSTDSASSSGSYVPNTDKKPLKSCLRKKNKGLRSRSMSDTFSLNFDDVQQKQKVKNRHSYACDEVYIVSDEFGQLMMYQADDAAEPVMFYLDKDGECHMTEGGKPDFEVLPNDVMGSDSSGSEKDSSNKRKSVSFASEVSFQAISPMISPKKQITQDDGGCECVKDGETKSQTGEQPTESSKTEATPTPAAETSSTPDIPAQDSGNTGCHSNNSSSSSSDGAPEEFQVAMDTNENNLWSKDVMEEKLGLLTEVTKAANILVEHFAESKDFFDKLRLGNAADTPQIGDLVLSTLCPALSHVISNGMKHHLAGFQMFGRVQVTIWKVVEASVEAGPQTRTLSDLVTSIKQTTFLTTHQQKFDAFVFGLLNYRLLDFWIGTVRAKEDQLSRYYEPDAILLHSNTVLKAKYDSVILSVQPLGALPFQLHSEFIKEKALTDSKMKSQEMASSKDNLLASANQIQGNNSLNEPTNDSVPTEITSVLELTATKALNWITKTALPKMSPHEYSPSKSTSLPLDLSSQAIDLNCSTNEMSESYRLLQRETKSLNDIEKLLEKHKDNYCDAKSSRIDSDHIISPTESMRSSQGSQYGPLSFLSNFTSRFDSGKTETSLNQSSLSPSMTSSVTSLVNKFFQFGANYSQRQAYKKGVTEYNFEEDQSELSEKLENEKAPKNTELVLKEEIATEPVIEFNEKQSTTVASPVAKISEEVKLRNKTKLPSPEKSSPKRVSFDIVNLFDKLLLPKSKDKAEKPVNESKSRWSWGLGTKHEVSRAKVKKVPKSKIPVTLNRNQSTKSTENSAGSQSTKDAQKQETGGVTPPPKPPRVQQQEEIASGRGNLRTLNENSSTTCVTAYDINSNSASV